MAGVRSVVLLSFLAAGVAGMAWLVWGFAQDVEPPDDAAVAMGREAVVSRTPAPTPAVVPLQEVFDDSLVDLLPRWARSPAERARWVDALRLGGSGLSRFERRLWIGDLLEHLALDFGAGRIEPERTHEHFAALFHLGALGIERWRSDAPAVAASAYGGRTPLVSALQEVTRPTRARRSFLLHGREADPLGTGGDLRLRVWTPRGQSVARDAVEGALSLLQRLDAVAAVDTPARVDVLATTARADDVFPALSQLPFPFIGVYLPTDRLAVVGTQHTPERFRRLIQHEVIHAWHHASRPQWNTTFTIEGLATYASHLRPQDEGLAVPADRLRDDLAWLLRAIASLRSRGVELTDVHLGALIRARPWEFYALGWFAYVVAEACFAHVGPEAIEHALRSGGEQALLARFGSVSWSELVGWVEEHAKGGNADAAWFVTETPPPGQEGPPERTVEPGPLADLGLRVRDPRRDDDSVSAPRRPSRPRPVRTPSRSRPSSTRAPTYDDRHYIGARGCKKCHFKHSRSWKKTAHARTYDLLAPGEAVEAKRKAGLDPEREFRSGHECLRCHTTGYGTPSGYPVPRAGDRLTDELRYRLKYFAGVSCEACHGMGSEYAAYKKDHERYQRRDIVALGANIPIRAEHCATCHKPGCPTMPRDYAFDFEAALRRESFHEKTPLKHDHGPAD